MTDTFTLTTEEATPSFARDLTREGFWRETFPELTIMERLTGQFAINPLRNEPAVVAGQKMQLEGYFQEQDPELVDLAGRLSRAISRCVELGIPPVFIFLFDEAWAAFHRQHQMIAMFLGADYQVLPDFWAWRVDPKAGQAGWRPHRDKGRMALAPDGAPISLTMWIPLTEASPLNGCMYMLPANRDPVYGTEQEKNWQVDFPSIRALPGKPGDYFTWNQAVLHWGAQSSPFAEKPRMSMALEFQKADVKPFNTPLLGTLPVLSFENRLKLTAKQIIQYKHMYPLPPEMQTLAQRVLAGG
ncbi:phytanoyl-CoA dioxygenase family protein [Caulobacter sp. NIBR2454]|uniref:phytanoyl-CoA dioxygenase family protein n=1 Tax=Caulobacter sp. NIBR2454 TaxID=3015996 RepID=UPI0022B6AE84|nr:phytanoyl-CoA dioxygenase family protein [Caulobacter sp. NIBR2454]